MRAHTLGLVDDRSWGPGIRIGNPAAAAEFGVTARSAGQVG